MKKTVFTGIFFYFLFSAFSDCQQVEQNKDIVKVVEKYFSDDEEEQDLETIIQDLYYYSVHPINLNYTTKEELQKLYLLNDFQIHSILSYRDTTGIFLTLNELYYIIGIPEQLAADLMYFVEVSSSPSQLKKEKFTVIPDMCEIRTRFEYQRESSEKDSSYKNPGYTGNDLKNLTSVNITAGNHLQAGLIMEKDAGEDFFGESNNYGYDYYSGFIQYNGNGLINHVLVGDYYMELGQGIHFWGNSGFGKSTNIFSLKKSGREIKKNTSRNENQYLRGIAAGINTGNIFITPFFSSKKLDANIIYNDSTGAFTSFQATGLHRTKAEIEDEDALKEKLAGCNVQYKHNDIQFGITASYTEFDRRYIKDEELYNLFGFEGNSVFNISIDYSVINRNIQFFGETGLGNKNLATLNGVLLFINSNTTLSVVHRFYEAGYYARYESALAENTHAANEQGLLLAAEIYPVSNLRIFGYYDFFKFPWLSFGRSAPSSGSEYVIASEYKLNERIRLSIQYKSEIKQEDYNESVAIPVLTDIQKRRSRLNIHYPVSMSIKMITGIHASWIRYDSASGNSGYLFYHDIRYNPEKSPVEFTMRYSVFNIDDYDARIYTYERDYHYSYTSVMNYWSGQRLSLFLKLKLNSHLSLWSSYAFTLPQDHQEKYHSFKIEAKLQL